MPSLFPSSFFLIVLFIYLSTTPSLSDPRATEAALMCTNRTASPSERQTFIANFLAALDSITPLINTDRYASVVKGTQNATVFAFGECMKDLSQTDCNLCFAQCKTQILRCLPFQKATRGGRLFYDGCYLRYDDYNFFSEALSAVDKKVCGSTNSSGNSTVPKAIVMDLMRNLSVVALKNDGFYTGFVSSGNLSVYGLAQCWEYVNGSNCEKCLDDAISKINSCPPEEEGRVLNAGCYLRYSTQKFYNNSASPPEGGNDGNRLAVILAATSSALAFLLIVTATVMFAMKRVQKRKRERKQLGSLLAKVHRSELNISYETLEKATNYFHSSHKLGQGGSGSVYKGILPNGKAVAIKRLFFNTRQWVDHFFNEVNLISGLHHKNLVKLLGCSITGPESLLVYEYVENRSLSDHLCVDRENVQPLSWEVRYKIIVGTAEGLAYLHEESKLRIIHRDIKLSNILLDEDFTPKIADFGLARLFPEDKTHITTAIAGTLGYMAPEYVVRGKLTEKADVYSFGVLVLELICGKTNNSACQNSLPILQTVWDLYGRGRICEAVDPSLEANFNEGEASRVLQIGLLCVQASADLRPSMSTVVKMLNDNTAIPRPTQPPFLNSNSVEIRPIIQNESSSSLLGSSKSRSSGNSMTQSWVDPR